MFKRIEFTGWDELRAAWQRAPGVVHDELMGAMYESELLIERNVQELTPEGAYKNLKGSIAAQTPEISGETVLGVVGTAAPYAIPVELGTRPHFPPVQSLVDWVIAKLDVPEKGAKGVAFLVARKISREGTKGAAMFQRGMEKSEPIVEKIFREALERIRAQLSGGAA